MALFAPHLPCVFQTNRVQPAGPRPRVQDDGPGPGSLGGSGSGNSFVCESLPFIPRQVDDLGSLQCLWGKELEDISLLRDISGQGGSAASDASRGEDVASAMADLKNIAFKPPPKHTKPSEPSEPSASSKGAWLFEEINEDHEPTGEVKGELEAALKTEADYAARENDAAEELESGGRVADDDADDSDSGPDSPDGLDGPAPAAGASGSGGGPPAPPAAFYAPGSDEHPYNIYDRFMNDSRGLATPHLPKTRSLPKL